MKDKYIKLCKEEASIPVFSQPWWLDAVCGKDNWDVCLVQKGKDILASMPYFEFKKSGFTYNVQPPLTQKLGPWISPSKSKYSKALGQEKDLMENLISQLPKFDFFSQSWDYKNTNWLPFYWKGFEQTTKYTYVINNLSDIDSICLEFENSKRKNIKKAEGMVNIVFDIPYDEFYENHKYTLEKQGSKISYSKVLFKTIYEAAYLNNSGRTIAAYDKEGNLHAAIFVIWDSESAYDLISTIDPDYRTYGAASLLIKSIIEFLSGKTCKFDFEGSMIESVERSFRQFGAKQTPYFNVYKTTSKKLLLLKNLKSILS